MRRFRTAWRALAGLLAALASFQIALAQGMSVPGVVSAGGPIGMRYAQAGAGGSGGGGGYVGPGDVVSGAKYYWGLRAYSAAVAATGTAKAVKVVRSTDSQSCDVLIATSGDLGDVANCSGAGSGPAATFCGANCVIDVWYDQLGSTTGAIVSGGAAALVFGCAGGKPCAQFSGAEGYEVWDGSATAQPFTISAAAIRTGDFSGQDNILVDAGGDGAYFDPSGGQVGAWFGVSGATVSAADNAWHALQLTLNGSSSAINVDGTDTTSLGIGAAGYSGDFYIAKQPSGGNYLTGKMGEVGLWPAAWTSTQRHNACANQAAYWGITC